LGGWLAGRGHEVTWLVTAPEHVDAVTEPDGLRIAYRTRGRSVGAGRFHVDDLLRCVVPIGRGVRANSYDIVDCHHFVDAAGTRFGRRHRAPYLMSLPGVPRRDTLGGRPLRRLALRYALGGAARIHCLSEYARHVLRREFDLEGHVMPAGVDTERYAGDRPSGEPIVLCTAAAGDPRKQVDVLVRAFPLLLRQRPDARLVLAPPDPSAAERLLALLDDEVRTRCELRAGLDFDALAALYREAAVSVLPSVEEAFGLVIVESLAAGTPVVGADHGAIPEIITSPEIGALFEASEPEALAKALASTLELAGDPATPARCRAHARQWDWSEIGPRMEAAYGRLNA
jgi:phosphatidylinositol alpha-mannosyltransferase